MTGLTQHIRICALSILLIGTGVFFITCNKNKAIIVPRPGTVNDPRSQKRSDTIATVYTLYLSFDDGPVRASREVSEVAMSDSIHISVFLIGRYAFRDDSSWQLFQLYRNNPFIEIGNHSFSHANNHYRLFYKKPEEVKADFLMNYDTLGLESRIARLPGRNSWRINGRERDDLPDVKASADSLANMGYRVFGWDIEWHYNSEGKMIENADQIFEKIQRITLHKSSFTAGNIIILCHDPMLADSSNKAELESFIQKIKSNTHYRFESLDKYPQ
ncbi:MAG TPA: polysaccharide deacetylase family protein [Puia sp.]|nr:polysaccharide deacetylase family protein [Puia sp.]